MRGSGKARDRAKHEALPVLAGVIEDLFYVATLAQSTGDHDRAGRLGKIAEDVARERAKIEVELRKPVTS